MKPHALRFVDFVRIVFRRFDEALLILLVVPFALIGGFWFIYALGHNLSIASAVGFIALAGVAAE